LGFNDQKGGCRRGANGDGGSARGIIEGQRRTGRRVSGRGESNVDYAFDLHQRWGRKRRRDVEEFLAAWKMARELMMRAMCRREQVETEVQARSTGKRVHGRPGRELREAELARVAMREKMRLERAASPSRKLEAGAVSARYRELGCGGDSSDK